MIGCTVPSCLFFGILAPRSPGLVWTRSGSLEFDLGE